MTIEDYLDKMAGFVDSNYGKLIRRQFADDEGSGELAMLASPTKTELAEFRRAVAIMTPAEKTAPEALSDEQIQRIAEDARVDPANLAIFMNGYILQCKQGS